MGILRGTARLLLDEHRREPFSGSVLELGKSYVFFTPDELQTWADRHQVPLVEQPWKVSENARLAAHGCMSDVAFFRSLGLDEVVSSDISPHDGADVLFDLNQDLPPELENRFDLVFDGGTLHHVFDLPQALHNVHRALKVGGRLVLGSGASNNHVDHGFYMFSPTLFHDYFEANRYRIDAAFFFEFDHYWVDGRLFSPPWRIYDYHPGVLDRLSYGGLGGRQVGLFFAATKTSDTTTDVVPQQSYFRRHLPALTAGETAASRPVQTRRGAGYRLAKRWSAPLRRRWARRDLVVVARY